MDRPHAPQFASAARRAPRVLHRRASASALALLTFVGLMLVVSVASAQSRRKYVVPTEEQVALGQEALEAFVARDFDSAIGKYRKSLAIKEMNITWITLGYALFAKGRCQEASDAYARAAKAPRVKPPPYPRQLAEMLAEYEGQLPTQCGRIQLVCSPVEGMRVSIDGAAERACSGEPIWIKAGSHKVIGVGSNGLRDVETVEIVAGAEARVELDVPDVDKGEVSRLRGEGEEIARAMSTTSLGLATRVEADRDTWQFPSDPVLYTAAGGASLLGVTLLLDLFWAGSTYSDLELASRMDTRSALADYDRLQEEFASQQSVVQVFFAAGVITTVVAVGMYLFDVGVEREGGGSAGEETSVGGWFAPGGGGLVVERGF